MTTTGFPLAGDGPGNGNARASSTPSLQMTSQEVTGSGYSY